MSLWFFSERMYWKTRVFIRKTGRIEYVTCYMFLFLYKIYMHDKSLNLNGKPKTIIHIIFDYRIISAAYDWNSAQTDKTEYKAIAVTLDPSDMYSYKSDFNSQIAAAKDIVKSLS